MELPLIRYSGDIAPRKVDVVASLWTDIILNLNDSVIFVDHLLVYMHQCVSILISWVKLDISFVKPADIFW